MYKIPSNIYVGAKSSISFLSSFLPSPSFLFPLPPSSLLPLPSSLPPRQNFHSATLPASSGSRKWQASAVSRRDSVVTCYWPTSWLVIRERADDLRHLYSLSGSLRLPASLFVCLSVADWFKCWFVYPCLSLRSFVRLSTLFVSIYSYLSVFLWLFFSSIKQRWIHENDIPFLSDNYLPVYVYFPLCLFTCPVCFTYFSICLSACLLVRYSVCLCLHACVLANHTFSASFTCVRVFSSLSSASEISSVKLWIFSFLFWISGPRWIKKERKRKKGEKKNISPSPSSFHFDSCIYL